MSLRSFLVAALGTLTMFLVLATAVPASAGKFNGYFTCYGAFGDSDSSCVEGDGLMAVFRSKKPNTNYMVCLWTPDGTKKCATKKTHGAREPSPMLFFSSGLGTYQAVWRVQGHGVVDRAEMRLRSEGVKRDAGDRCDDGPRFYVRVLVGKANCSNARRALRGFMDNVYASNPPCYPGQCQSESPGRWRCKLKNTQLTEEAGRTARCKRIRDSSVGVLIYKGESVTGDKASSLSKKACGSFRLEGLMTPVRVKIARGDFPCKIARRVMNDLYNGRDTGQWDCIGPQTGYAKCTKHNRGAVVGRF